MDTGIIASRYARALLKYVAETGEGEQVCQQAGRLERALAEVPELSALLDNPETVSAAAKMKLFAAALDGEKMAPSLERFLALVLEKGRTPLLRLMLHDFIDFYHRSQKILHAHLTTVTPAGEETLSRLRELVRSKTGFDVVIAAATDPSLIGGFVFEIEDYTLDASAAHQLRQIRRQFIENNRRIV